MEVKTKTCPVMEEYIRFGKLTITEEKAKAVCRLSEITYNTLSDAYKKRGAEVAFDYFVSYMGKMMGCFASTGYGEVLDALVEVGKPELVSIIREFVPEISEEGQIFMSYFIGTRVLRMDEDDYLEELQDFLINRKFNREKCKYCDHKKECEEHE